ncbi:MAG: M48 family metalloprotease [Pseudomonadota bacterium]
MKKIFMIGVAAIAIGAKAPKPLPSAQPITAGDRTVGAKAHPQILEEFGGVYESKQAAYVTKVGRRIALRSGLSNAEGDFTISLLNSSVNNAFAIPGGYVYVTRQLLALMNSEAELASVLGHEVGHVAARHSKQREKRARVGGLGAILATVAGSVLLGDTGAKLGQQLGGTLAQSYVLGFSRAQEYEADDLGVSYLAKTGYDPFAASSMLASLAAQTSLDTRAQGQKEQSLPSWQRTHPDPGSRVMRAADRAKTFIPSGKERNRDEFLAAIDGMIYGDDPKQGIVDGQNFSHPDLRLRFDAPSGYAMSNGTQAVAVRGSGGQAQFAGAPYNGDMNAYIDKIFKAVGGTTTTINYGNISRTNVNGIPSATASATANGQSGPVVVTVFAYEFAPDKAYHFLTITPASNSNPFGSMFESVRRLSLQEAAAIKPRRVSVVTVKSKDTIASLAARMAYRDLQVERFLTLNALASNATLTSGQKVKLIVY